jgi:hypothetical protein
VADASLDEIVRGLIAGANAGLSEVKRQKSPEAVAPVIDIKAKIEQIADMKKRLKMAEDQAKLLAEDAARDEAETKAKDAAIKGIGERFGPAAGDLARLTGGSQFSSEVVNKMFGVEDAQKGEPALLRLMAAWEKDPEKFKQFFRDMTGAKTAPPKPTRVDFTPAELTALRTQYEKIRSQKKFRDAMVKSNPKAAQFLPDPGEVPATIEEYLKQQRENLVNQAEPMATDTTSQGGLSEEELRALMEESLQ